MYCQCKSPKWCCKIKWILERPALGWECIAGRFCLFVVRRRTSNALTCLLLLFLKKTLINKAQSWQRTWYMGQLLSMMGHRQPCPSICVSRAGDRRFYSSCPVCLCSWALLFLVLPYLQTNKNIWFLPSFCPLLTEAFFQYSISAALHSFYHLIINIHFQ